MSLTDLAKGKDVGDEAEVIPGITHCAKCGHEISCPCEHCQKRKPVEKPWVWISGNGPIACGNCGGVLPE